MKRMVWVAAVVAVLTAAPAAIMKTRVDAAGGVDHEGTSRGNPFVVDVAMDGATWRMHDGTNPFFPTFTGDLARGKTFIVSGRIYRGGTLQEGGEFGGATNPPGPELPDAIGTWVCRGAFNLDIADIMAGAFPHVTSTQIFTFDRGGVIVTEGPEGGGEVLRAIVGGAGRYRSARGDVVEIPLGVNTSNLFNVRFRLTLD